MNNSILVMGIVPFLLTECTTGTHSEPKDIEEQYHERGRMAIPLTTTSSSGELYRLQIPEIRLYGPEDEVILKTKGEEGVDVSLREGEWMMRILEGWRMEQLVDGEYVAVSAEMTSENPQFFQIEGGETTAVQIRFQVLDCELKFQTGDLEIQIEIQDQPDNPEPETTVEPEEEPKEDSTSTVIDDQDCYLADQCFSLSMSAGEWDEGWWGSVVYIYQDDIMIDSGLEESRDVDIQIAGSFYLPYWSNENEISFCVNGGSTLSLQYVQDEDYQGEDGDYSYQLYDQDGTLLFSDGGFPEEGEVFSIQNVGGVEESTSEDCSDSSSESSTMEVLSAGIDHTCGIDSSNAVQCWGLDEGGVYEYDDWGRFVGGSGDFGQVTNTPETGPFTQVASGSFHSCGVRADGVVQCWGIDNEDLNYDKGQVTDTPTENGFVQVSVGEVHSCALKEDGSIQCWGDELNYRDESGDVISGENFTQVSAGSYHTCAIKTSGSVQCWGDMGELFNRINVPSASFVQIDAGLDNTCGIMTSGSIQCWGYENMNPPVGRFTQVSMGSYQSCAINQFGSIDCWSDWFDAQRSVPSGSNFVQVSVGGDHVCAVERDGAVQCWFSEEVVSDHGQTSAPVDFVSILKVQQ